VDALDPRGQPFPFALPVTAEVTGANPGTLTGELVALGQYALEYTPTSPGEDHFAITIEGETLPGSFASTVGPVPASAANSTFQVSESQVGSPTRVRVDVRDAAGDSYQAGETFPVAVNVTVSSQATGATLFSLSATDGDGSGVFDGTYEASFVLNRPGAYRVAVSVGGQATPDGPRNLIPDALPADPEQSTVEVSEAVVGEATTISVLVFNTAADVYDYNDYRQISVDVSVTGANPTSFQATDDDLDGTFSGQYTPVHPGIDNISVRIDGETVPGTVTSDVDALAGALRVAVSIAGGAPIDGLPVELRRTGGTLVAEGTTGSDGVALFPNVPHGDYRALLAARDFDVDFSAMSIDVRHDAAGSPWVFEGVTRPLPDGVEVWRLRDGGNGNAYQYVGETLSWTGARSAADAHRLLDTAGHLATRTSREENDFAGSLFTAAPTVCVEGGTPASCSDQAWIGLTDSEREGRFRWVTDEAFEFTRWREGRVARDPWGTLDFVAFDARGFWSATISIEASDPGGQGPQGVVVDGVDAVGGYLVEWEAESETGGT